VWRNHEIIDAIEAAWARGAIIGGNGAGVALLGEFGFAGRGGTVASVDTLADPYGPTVDLVRDFIDLPLLADVVLDPRFFEFDRMGRLLGFGARVLEDGWSTRVVALGLDQTTAVVVEPDGQAEVLGDGAVYLFAADQPAAVCEPDTALEFGPVMVRRLELGDRLSLPDGQSNDGPSYPVSASMGVTDPADPY
jgi:cyanophycinase-like exopeptidase